MKLVQKLLERIKWLENHPKVRVKEKTICQGADPQLLAQFEGKFETEMLDFYREINGLSFSWRYKDSEEIAGSFSLPSFEEMRENFQYSTQEISSYLLATFRTLGKKRIALLADIFLLDSIPDLAYTLLIIPKDKVQIDFMFIHKTSPEETKMLSHHFEEYIQKAIDAAFILEWQIESSETHIHYQKLFKNEVPLNQELKGVMELLESEKPVNTKLAFNLLEGMGLAFNISLCEALIKWPNRVLLCLEHGFFDILHPTKHNFNRIKKLPEEIAGLQDLEELGLNFCMLKELPDSIKSLKKLKKIYLNNNEFSSFPEQLYDLESLEVLRFARNKISHLGEGIIKLKNLKELNISRNLNLQLDSYLWELSSLEIIDLRWLDIKIIPPEILNLKKLQTLKLSGNKFIDFPEVICKLSQLKSLDISGNKIEHLPEAILELKNLEHLNIRNTAIEKLPNWLQSLSKLKRIEHI